MEPLGIYLGLKVVPILVLWGRSIFYLGTSALRVSKQALTCVCVCFVYPVLPCAQRILY